MGNPDVLPAQGQVTDPGSPRGRLLACAARLFREKGYERTTVRDIAAAVGIQSGSIFHHFSSKEALLKAVMAQALLDFTGRLHDAIEAEAQPQAQLLACIASELQFTIGDDTGAVMSVLINEWRSLSPQHQSDILKLRARYEQHWIDVLTRAQQAGLVVGDVFVIRRLLAGSIHWTPTWYRIDGELSLADLARTTLRMACSGGSEN